MKVQEIMSSRVVTVTPATSYKELWNSILKKHLHSLPVIDKHKKIVGIVAEEDLLKPLYPDYTRFIEDLTSAHDFESMEDTIREIVDLSAKHIMKRRIVFTRPETPIMRALSRMLVHDIRQLPVVDEGDVLVGVISKGDIFKALFKRQEKKELHLHMKLSKRLKSSKKTKKSKTIKKKSSNLGKKSKKTTSR